ncbi:MAG: glutathione S-transferase N-terminal domain-containing protein [Burkholderiales bacterium]
MIDLYSANSSNGQRVAITLEECGLPYRLHKLDLFAGDQRKPEYLAINPGAAIPAIVDQDGPGGTPFSLAQSGAIVVYLAEKSGRFLPRDPRARAEALQWVFQATTDVAAASGLVFIMSRFMPDKTDANMAFCEERTLRYLRVAESRLADREHLAGELSIADFSLYPLVALRRPMLESAGDMPHLLRWADAIGARPAVVRGMKAAE